MWAGRDVIRYRNGRPVDAQFDETRVDPAALIVHTAEFDPGGVGAAAAVTGDDVDLLALGNGIDDRIVVTILTSAVSTAFAKLY